MCATVFVGVTFRILSEGMFLLSPLLLLMEGMTVMMLGRVWLLMRGVILGACWWGMAECLGGVDGTY